jgi:hypothetical protein
MSGAFHLGWPAQAHPVKTTIRSTTTQRPMSQRALARGRERELRLAQEAIAMVACGATRRVVIAGIRHGDDILESARRIGLASGVRVNPLRQLDTDAADLVIEPIYD